VSRITSKRKQQLTQYRARITLDPIVAQILPTLKIFCETELNNTLTKPISFFTEVLNGKVKAETSN
jgi:hypothetical protein